MKPSVHLEHRNACKALRHAGIIALQRTQPDATQFIVSFSRDLASLAPLVSHSHPPLSRSSLQAKKAAKKKDKKETKKKDKVKKGSDSSITSGSESDSDS
jgi:hypothetical protein